MTLCHSTWDFHIRVQFIVSIAALTNPDLLPKAYREDIVRSEDQLAVTHIVQTWMAKGTRGNDK